MYIYRSARYVYSRLSPLCHPYVIHSHGQIRLSPPRSLSISMYVNGFIYTYRYTIIFRVDPTNSRLVGKGGQPDLTLNP